MVIHSVECEPRFASRSVGACAAGSCHDSPCAQVSARHNESHFSLSLSLSPSYLRTVASLGLQRAVGMHQRKKRSASLALSPVIYLATRY